FGSSPRKSLSQRDGKTVLGSAPQLSSVLKSAELLLAMAYPRNGTFLPSGVGGVACLLSSKRISSFFPAFSALDQARRRLDVHYFAGGKRWSTVLMIFVFPPSRAKLKRSCPSAHGVSGWKFFERARSNWNISRFPCIAVAITGVKPFLSARSTIAPASRIRRAVFQSSCDAAINSGVRLCPSRPFGSTRSIRHKSISDSR